MRKYFFVLLTIFHISVFAQAGKESFTVRDGDITENSGDVYWTSDKVYMLDGFVYVEAPSVLHIEAGTVIKGMEQPTTGDIASALIITRGAKIMAEGTKTSPIIFTTEYDDTDLPDDGTDPGVDYTIDRGLWGGLVLLGKAVLNVAEEKVVEGLPATEERAKYGGNDDNDNSGVLRYISIRYTGITVEANKELQGLTVGCVGDGTAIEYIESFNSDDDGFEFFGGIVNTKYLVSAFNSDDSFDYDQGFRGHHQFWFAIQDIEKGDHIGEWDSGDEGALTAEPLSKPIIYNATFLGRGTRSSGGDAAINLKEYGGVEFYNSIITDFDENGAEVDSGAGMTSYTRWQNGEIKFENNIWWKEGNGVADYTPQAFMRGDLGNAANNNYDTDPQLTGLDRRSNKLLDPRPMAGGSAYSLSRKAYPNENFDEVNYIGAFGSDLWISQWTALWQNGIVTDQTTDVSPEQNTNEIPVDYALSQNYPNPFNPSTTIDFALPSASNVRLTIYNLLGQEITTLVNEFKQAGSYKVTWNAQNLPSGIYIYRIESAGNNITRKMTLLK